VPHRIKNPKPCQTTASGYRQAAGPWRTRIFANRVPASFRRRSPKNTRNTSGVASAPGPYHSHRDPDGRSVRPCFSCAAAARIVQSPWRAKRETAAAGPAGSASLRPLPLLRPVRRGLPHPGDPVDPAVEFSERDLLTMVRKTGLLVDHGGKDNTTIFTACRSWNGRREGPHREQAIEYKGNLLRGLGSWAPGVTGIVMTSMPSVYVWER